MQLVSCILCELWGILYFCSDFYGGEWDSSRYGSALHRTQGNIKHRELDILQKWGYMMDLTGEMCVITGSVFDSLQRHDSSEHLEIILPPVCIRNSFSRPLSNMCITYIWKHSPIYIHIPTHIHLYTESKCGFRRKKAVTCMCIFPLLSHRYSAFSQTYLCFQCNLQAVVFTAEIGLAHWSTSLIAEVF